MGIIVCSTTSFVSGVGRLPPERSPIICDNPVLTASPIAVTADSPISSIMGWAEELSLRRRGRASERKFGYTKRSCTTALRRARMICSSFGISASSQLECATYIFSLFRKRLVRRLGRRQSLTLQFCPAPQQTCRLQVQVKIRQQADMHMLPLIHWVVYLHTKLL